jgi:hypothetical protein
VGDGEVAAGKGVIESFYSVVRMFNPLDPAAEVSGELADF